MISQNILPAPLVLQESIALNAPMLATVAESRKIITHILSGKDDRLLVIIGSPHMTSLEAFFEYGTKIAQVSNQWQKKLYVVLKLPILQLLHNEQPLEQALTHMRLGARDLLQTQIALAADVVDPLLVSYYTDLLSLSVIDNPHSLFLQHWASHLPMSVLIGNSYDGSLDASIMALQTGHLPQDIVSVNDSGHICHKKTSGNPSLHLLLRGGSSGYNYHQGAILEAQTTIAAHHLPASILVDCVQPNAPYRHDQQASIAKYVVEQKQTLPSLPITGIALQSSPHLLDTLSCCLDWSSTVELLVNLCDTLSIKSLV